MKSKKNLKPDTARLTTVKGNIELKLNVDIGYTVDAHDLQLLVEDSESWLNAVVSDAIRSALQKGKLEASGTKTLDVTLSRYVLSVPFIREG